MSSQTEPHIQDSKPDPLLEFEPAADPTPAPAPQVAQSPERSAPPEVTLGTILNACPDVNDFTKGGIANWRDLIVAAEIVRRMLGVTPSAWQAAIAVMGERAAAVVMAAILQRGSAIANAGGYLRALTEKAHCRQFSLGPMLMALIRTRNREKNYG